MYIPPRSCSQITPDYVGPHLKSSLLCVLIRHSLFYKKKKKSILTLRELKNMQVIFSLNLSWRRNKMLVVIA